MESTLDPNAISTALADELRTYVREWVARRGGDTRAVKPSHRVKFQWPPHPISYSFHVVASDWKGKTWLDVDGERLEVEVAKTPYGVFGRCPAIWNEARGATESEMLKNLLEASEPLFRRQRQISATLELSRRFKGHIRELSPLDKLKLLYCENRDVANEARTEIETQASTHIYFPALISVLDDRIHPNRRSAQWCVLDLFEALPSFCCRTDDELEAVRAVRDLIWDAGDDYARTIYKAGVVLGGHLADKQGGQILIECLQAPCKIGRRSAIHGLFHVVEWMPEMTDKVLSALRKSAADDSEPLLRSFASAMADDIENGAIEHVQEPVFPDED